MIANTIIAHVFLQASLHQVDVAAMEQLVAEYPYFSAARLLLARKVYHQHGDLHDPAIKKAMLYSGQPHHFYHIVTHEPVLETVEDRVPPAIPVDALPDGLSVAPETAVMETPVPAPAEVHGKVTATAENTPEGLTEIPVVAAAETTVPEGLTEIPVVAAAETTAPEGRAGSPVAATAEQLTGVAEAGTDNGAATIAMEAETLAATEVAEETPAAVNTATPLATAINGAKAEETAEPETVPADVEAAHQEAVLSDIPEPADMLTAPEGNHTPHPSATKATEQATDTKDERPIKIFPLEIRSGEEITEETVLTFQPLYTDDYFAYKRLKNPEDADELSAQGEAEMKSFTSWLRQIKDNFSGRTSKDWYHQQLHRIYEEDEEPEVSETVEKMAMESITFNNDIVSETLAEIWVRQHQYQQAIRIYQKLSLLNPDKNAYFAQKIQELKSLIDKSKH
ncbi:hypothetical protein SAMN04488128_1031000 [Chitinophaga eiseniae]|uniref:Tetratricopeptide repeat-containing protein n=1 Tax=Chitinophaga eiseniae TaxID=634771 RepID=A0A1T4T1P0_9BACT|nr:hypothetical protein [Chitinophaga eiseniae]SKA34404.1 hypothetical protein SAMN04488128_1031000 [Chitinophaga eiseniae]